VNCPIKLSAQKKVEIFKKFLVSLEYTHLFYMYCMARSAKLKGKIMLP
jgi:hypothetical protein